MDGPSFDTLARFARAAASRRNALKSAFIPALAGLGAASFLDGGNSAAKKKKKKCKKCKPLGAGEPCTTNKECCTNETNRLCAFASSGPNELVCCGGADAACSVDDDCCGVAACDNGFCNS